MPSTRHPDPTPPHTDRAAASARLHVHADWPAASTAATVEATLQRWRTRYAGPRKPPTNAVLAVMVEDLFGTCWHRAEKALPHMDIDLPAGTYRVSATLGSVKRCFTLTLEPATSVDLHLNVAGWR